MSYGNESVWARLDRDNRDCWRVQATRWRVGNLAEALHREQHHRLGALLVSEAETVLRVEAARRERREAARAEGWRAGEPGE